MTILCAILPDEYAPHIPVLLPHAGYAAYSPEEILCAVVPVDGSVQRLMDSMFAPALLVMNGRKVDGHGMLPMTANV